MLTMSIKACAYINCENYILDNVPCGAGNFTLFQFPRDEERRKQWLMMGMVPKNLTEARNLFMCSDHFDSKYLSVSQRRTILLNVGVPKDARANATEKQPFNDLEREGDSLEHIFEIDSNAEKTLQELTLNESDQEEFEMDQSLQDKKEVRQMTYSQKPVEYDRSKEHTELKYKRAFRQDAKSNCEVLEEFVTSIAQNSDRVDRKRKADSSITPSTSKLSQIRVKKLSEKGAKTLNLSVEIQAQQKWITSSHSFNEINGGLASEEIKSGDDLIDPKHVTTFIFKSEEYVQMPKEYYVQEKSELMLKIKQYEATLKAIRQHVNTAGLS